MASDETKELEIARLGMDWVAGVVIPKRGGPFCFYDDVAQKLRQAARDAELRSVVEEVLATYDRKARFSYGADAEVVHSLKLHMEYERSQEGSNEE